jgi:hypothetical protein
MGQHQIRDSLIQRVTLERIFQRHLENWPPILIGDDDCCAAGSTHLSPAKSRLPCRFFDIR